VAVSIAAWGWILLKSTISEAFGFEAATLIKNQQSINSCMTDKESFNLSPFYHFFGAMTKVAFLSNK
jgi:hypothetical protein